MRHPRLAAIALAIWGIEPYLTSGELETEGTQNQ